MCIGRYTVNAQSVIKIIFTICSLNSFKYHKLSLQLNQMLNIHIYIPTKLVQIYYKCPRDGQNCLNIDIRCIDILIFKISMCSMYR
jgi:hypothetical protein